MKRDELRWIPKKPNCEGGLRGFATVSLNDTKPGLNFIFYLSYIYFFSSIFSFYFARFSNLTLSVTAAILLLIGYASSIIIFLSEVCYRKFHSINENTEQIDEQLLSKQNKMQKKKIRKIKKDPTNFSIS